MVTIRITSKRQATLPKALCEELGVGPGAVLTLDRRTLGGETVWVIRPDRPDWSWFGAARRYSEGVSHAWDDVAASVARGLANA